MAAVQHGKKKVQPQKQRSKRLHVKSTGKAIQSKQKQVQKKQAKEKQKKLLKKGKKTQHSSKNCVAKAVQALQRKKVSLPTRSGGKNGGSRVNSPRMSSHAKVGRNLCLLSSKDLQYEVNELIRKKLTAYMFAGNGRVSH